MIRALLLAAAAATLAASAAGAAPLSAEQVRARATVDADPLEFTAEITTHRAQRSVRAAAGTVKSDAYLAATLDRATGATRYQLRKEFRYTGPRRDFHAVQFLDDGELRRAPLAASRHGADHCPNSDFNGTCLLTKTLAFDLSEPLLQRIAAAKDQPWRFRLKEAGGRDVTGAIDPAEAEGLLLAVADYRARTKLAAN